MKNLPEEIGTASHLVVFVNAVATPLVVVNWIGPKQVAIRKSAYFNEK